MASGWGKSYYPEVLLVAFTIVNENDQDAAPPAATQLVHALATIGPPMEDQTERVQRSCH